NNFELFQIDDGYESFVGDWKICNSNKFPNGLKNVVNKIKEKKLMPGIWVAPFVAQEGSMLVKNHPNWLKLVDGKPVKCGSNWGGFYALDFYNEEVRAYIKECLLYFKDLGFEFFKLDFLYAVSLPLYEGKNRSMVACEAYRFLRDVLQDSIILGNSCNMSPAFGVFDYVRIGPSITSEFDDSWVMRKMHRERNSTKVAIQNTIYRSIFNGKVFMNDPDVFLLRKELKMSFEQKYSLAMINAIFGSILMTSDDITTYAALYQNYDKRAAKIFDNIVHIQNCVENVEYIRRDDNKIRISYDLDDASHVMIYDPEEGILEEI
ncbi:MAG: alpha-galactosidase, partial [Acholeplasmatales bacterium]|nr:alpha-galactosidase [Acholeplasmatales bacterium]